jgi:hypothetical protein
MKIFANENLFKEEDIKGNLIIITPEGVRTRRTKE